MSDPPNIFEIPVKAMSDYLRVLRLFSISIIGALLLSSVQGHSVYGADSTTSISSINLPLPTSHELLDAARKQLKANWTLENGYTGKGVSVAVLDDGAQIDHEQLKGRIIEEVCVNYAGRTGYYECRNGKTLDVGPGAADYIVQPSGRYLSGTRHGTNAISSVLEFAPDVKIIPIKTGDPESAYRWIFENAKKYNIVAFSMSYGRGWARDAPIPQFNGLCVDLNDSNDIFRKLWGIGVVPVASSANSGQFDQVDHPACSPWVISVGSVDVGQNKISNYSNISNRLSLLAPAGFETANVTDEPAVKNAYFTFGGTSQATPVAAALFAIGKSIKPDATNDELRGIARMTAVSVDDKIAKDNKIIQFENFVKRLLEPQTGFRELTSISQGKDQLKISWQVLSGADRFELKIDRSRTIKIPGNQSEYILNNLKPNYSGMAELIAFDKAGHKIWQEEEFIQASPYAYKGIGGFQVTQNAGKLLIKWNDFMTASKIQLFINGFPVKETFDPSSELIQVSTSDSIKRVRVIKIKTLDKVGSVIDSKQLAIPWIESKAATSSLVNLVKVSFMSNGKPNFEVKVSP